MNEKQSGLLHIISGIVIFGLAMWSAWNSSEVQALRTQIRAAIPVVKADEPTEVIEAGPCKCCKCEACQCAAIERQSNVQKATREAVERIDREQAAQLEKLFPCE